MLNPHLNWIILISITLLSYLLAEPHMNPTLTGLVLILTSIKAALIVDGFMELQGIRHLVRLSLLLYCPLLAVLIWCILVLPLS